MRALWIVRSDLETRRGGDTVQILETARALEELGCEIELCADPRPALEGFDLVHLFHLDRVWENLPHARRARSHGLPAVLSTIWWPAPDFDRGGRGPLEATLARALGPSAFRSARLFGQSTADWLRSGLVADRRPLLGFLRAVREELAGVAVVLPNSHAELEALRRELDCHTPAVVVPNAVDARAFRAAQGEEPDEDAREGVLCVGRIEPRKNQLALVRALKDLDAHLTFVGAPGRRHEGYARRCRAEADASVRFLGQLPQAEVRDLLRRARVHALPSWYETPGLATLEAALCGCRVVATRGGCTEEYLGEDAWYCAPDDPASIRAAVERALAAPPPTRLARRVSTELTWRAAAERTLEAYERALRSVRPALVGAVSVGTAGVEAST